MTETVPRHMLKALAWPRYLRSAWPWRALAYALTTIPVAAPVTIGVGVLGLPWLAAVERIRFVEAISPPLVVSMLIGPVLIAVLGPLVAVPLAAAERQRLSIVDPRPLVSAHRPAHGDPVRWLRIRYTEAGTWREVAYTFILAIVAPVAYGMLFALALLTSVFVLSPVLVASQIGTIALGVTEVSRPSQALPYTLLGLVLVPVVLYLLGLVAAGQVVVARALLGTSDTTALHEVARSRARLVDAFDAERRRIERDLHDGAQHRLTSLTLQLGIARMDIADDSPAAVPLARAHEQAKELMAVLRELIHGIRPQLLSELGLAAALRDLASRASIPVTVTVSDQLTQRLSELVESTAYFVVSEALTNVGRHSQATSAEVSAAISGGLAGGEQFLILEIRDNGRGGAEPGRGSGLTGLADRVAATGGRLLLSSPEGGPTLVRVELPCRR